MNFTLYDSPRQALNWLLPQRCLNCDDTTTNKSLICEACYPLLPFQAHYCGRCGQNYSVNTDFCGHCINNTPSFDACFCPFRYESTVKELICALKYRERPELSGAAAYLLKNELEQSNIALPDALIAVPMHVRRLRERGYNHASLIAFKLSKLLKIPLINNVLSKSKYTPPQAQQNLSHRRKNLRGSFKLKKNISFKSVAIIDDVVTSGATAEEIAKILKRNGVDYIQIWGIAHTL